MILAAASYVGPLREGNGPLLQPRANWPGRIPGRGRTWGVRALPWPEHIYPVQRIPAAVPTKGYTSVGIPTDLAQLIDKFLEGYPVTRNRNQFIVDAIRHYLPVAQREAKLMLSFK
jgi:hypothetical protein